MVEVGNKLKPFTLENVVDAMTKGDTVNSQESILFGSGKIIAAGAKKLESIRDIKEEGKRLVKSLNNDLKRYRAINAETLKTLKKLSLNYLALSGDFANQSKIFEFIITADKIDLDYKMKMLKEFTLENVMDITSQLSLFYENAEKRILEIEELINESINTAS